MIWGSIVAPAMAEIARQVTTEIFKKIKNKKSNEINLVLFEKNTKDALEKMEARVSDSETLINYLGKARGVLIATVNDINENVGYKAPSLKNRLFLAALEQPPTEDVINKVATTYTEKVFLSTPSHSNEHGIFEYAMHEIEKADAWLSAARGKIDEKP